MRPGGVLPAPLMAAAVLLATGRAVWGRRGLHGGGATSAGSPPTPQSPPMPYRAVCTCCTVNRPPVTRCKHGHRARRHCRGAQRRPGPAAPGRPARQSPCGGCSQPARRLVPGGPPVSAAGAGAVRGGGPALHGRHFPELQAQVQVSRAPWVVGTAGGEAPCVTALPPPAAVRPCSAASCPHHKCAGGAAGRLVRHGAGLWALPPAGRDRAASPSWRSTSPCRRPSTRLHAPAFPLPCSRVMLKVSGEALEGKQGFGIDPQVLQVGGAGSLAASLRWTRGGRRPAGALSLVSAPLLLRIRLVPVPRKSTAWHAAVHPLLTSAYPASPSAPDRPNRRP